VSPSTGLGASVAAVVPAAGKGARFGGPTPKSFLPVFGKPLFVHTLQALSRSYPFREIVLVVQASQIEKARILLSRHGLKRVRVIEGGRTRAASVRNGLLALSPQVKFAAVHDAARPLIAPDVVRRTVAAAQKSPSTGSGRYGGAICALPVSSTVKRIDLKKRVIRGTESRDELVLAQTPQVFEKKALLLRYRALGPRAFRATDEAALFDGSSVRIRVVEGDARNLKITTKTDLRQMKNFLKNGI
jgi:2-C-methyl-D-erythritol 4-phosphate cytidylyltransferase